MNSAGFGVFLTGIVIGIWIGWFLALATSIAQAPGTLP